MAQYLSLINMMPSTDLRALQNSVPSIKALTGIVLLKYQSVIL